MREIEVKVEPHGSSMNYYCIYYRYKKRFNFLNCWKRLVEVWDGASLTYDQPVMFEDFDYTVRYAKKLKENPELIKEHYIIEDEKYKKAKKRRGQYYQERNKSIKI